VYINDILLNHWGAELGSIVSNDEKTGLYVIVEPRDPQNKVEITPQFLKHLSEVPNEQSAFTWQVFSGQHQIEVLKRRLALANPEMSAPDVLELPHAVWCAKVFKSGVDFVFHRSACFLKIFQRDCILSGSFQAPHGHL
jgi:hypothetical protein